MTKNKYLNIKIIFIKVKEYISNLQQLKESNNQGGSDMTLYSRLTSAIHIS